MTPLRTARLRLEPLAPEHAGALYAVWADPEVARFLISRPTSRADFDELFERQLEAAGGFGMWALLEPEGTRPIGRVGFFAFGEERRPELAYLLARSAWGRGLASEAARAALEFGFAEPGFAEVVALIRPANARALAVARRLGMGLERLVELGGGPAELHRVAAARFRDARG